MSPETALVVRPAMKPKLAQSVTQCMTTLSGTIVSLYINLVRFNLECF